MKQELSADARAKALSSIKRYFSEQLEQEIGELQAGLLLDFVLEEIAPSVYNTAIVHAQTFVRDRVTDLEDSLFAPEFGYWRKKR